MCLLAPSLSELDALSKSGCSSLLEGAGTGGVCESIGKEIRRREGEVECGADAPDLWPRAIAGGFG